MISVRAASDEDRDRLIAFMESTGSFENAQRMDRRWAWQWHADPRLETPGYKGVVAEWDGQIVGSVSCIPAGLYIAGEPFPAIWLADVRINWGLARQALRDLRRRGQKKRTELSNGLAAAMFDHPAAGPGQLGKHIAEPMMAIGYRIGFVGMPAAANHMRRTSFRWPLQKAVGPRLGRLVAAVADLGIPSIPRPRLEVEAFSGAFDERFDRLWEKAKHDYPAITLRDSAVLNWHYRSHPDTSYRVFVIERGSELRGYVVLKVYLRKDRLIARIVDLLTDKGDAEAIEALVASALLQSRREGAERTDWFACGADLSPALMRLGFAPRLTKKSKAQPLMTRHLPDVPLYVTSGDGDGG